MHRQDEKQPAKQELCVTHQPEDAERHVQRVTQFLSDLPLSLEGNNPSKLGTQQNAQSYVRKYLPYRALKGMTTRQEKKNLTFSVLLELKGNTYFIAKCRY